MANEVTRTCCWDVLLRRSSTEVCLAAAALKYGDLLLTARSCASFDVLSNPPDLSSIVKCLWTIRSAGPYTHTLQVDAARTESFAAAGIKYVLTARCCCVQLETPSSGSCPLRWCPVLPVCVNMTHEALRLCVTELL